MIQREEGAPPPRTAAAHGPLPAWLAPASHGAAFFYGLGVRARAALLARRAPERAGVPVISVGNLTAGGTGKTPFVRWVVRTLQEAGHRPVIALRGYAAREGRSDEAMEYRALLAGTPIALGANRHAAIAAARAADPAIDCAVLDDGFQHRQLARDLDIVLVDATRPALDGALLPAGWLREPASALRRADLVVVTRARAAHDAALDAMVQRFHGAPPAAATEHAWMHLELHGERDGQEPPEWIRGKRVLIVAAIGNPGAFVADALRAGAMVVASRLLRDHAHFTAATVGEISAAAEAAGAAVLLTGKDWVKVAPLVASAPQHTHRARWVVVRSEIGFLAGEAAVRARVLAAAIGRR